MTTPDRTSPRPSVPFNRPFFAGKELHYIAQAVASGAIAGDGGFTVRCAALLEKRFGLTRALMTPSCTASLEMAAMLCDLEPGDEVILPSFTFVSTASAFVRERATPVFVDVRSDTFNLDVEQVERAIGPRTRAICAVHYAGVGCDMDELVALASRHGLRLIEDAAQAVGATYRGRPLGAIGALGCYSFHETKNVICGEGGALAINDAALVERAEILRDKGTDRKRFFRGQVDKYTWVDVGSSYVPSEIASAFLFAQLESIDAINARRRALRDRYRDGLADVIADGMFRGPIVPEDRVDNAHMYYLLAPNRTVRDELIAFLKERALQSVFHYVPLHSSPMGRKVGRVVSPRGSDDLPTTNDVSDRLTRLPLYYDLTDEDQDRVIAAIREFVGRRLIPAASVATGPSSAGAPLSVREGSPVGPTP